jgi:hypothetical protein
MVCFVGHGVFANFTLLLQGQERNEIKGKAWMAGAPFFILVCSTYVCVGVRAYYH